MVKNNIDYYSFFGWIIDACFCDLLRHNWFWNIYFDSDDGFAGHDADDGRNCLITIRKIMKTLKPL